MNPRKLLWKLSGDDYLMISVCNPKVQRRFSAIGFWVLVIFVLCFVSCYVTFTNLFQSYLIGIPAGLFFAFMITNIYLLLLYTLTDDVLPHVDRKIGRWASTGLRVIFIWFIAIVVSKPIEMVVFSSRVSEDIADFKRIQLQDFQASTDTYFNNETEQLRRQIETAQHLYGPASEPMIHKYRSLIENKERQKQELVSRMNILVGQSNYYIRGIAILNLRYPLCWLLSVLIIAVFTIPAYLKDFISSTDIFYKRKEEIELELVNRAYRSFKETYASLFHSLYGVDVVFTELYTDPPFNLTRKTDERRLTPESALIAELYDVDHK